MIKKTETVIVTCDLCGKQCEPVKEVELCFWGDTNATCSCRIKVEVDLSYCGYGDVCMDCLEQKIIGCYKFKTIRKLVEEAK